VIWRKIRPRVVAELFRKRCQYRTGLLQIPCGKTLDPSPGADELTISEAVDHLRTQLMAEEAG